MTDLTNKDVELAAQLEAILGGPPPSDPFTSDPFMTAHLLAVAVHKAGGKFDFTQAAIDEVDGLAMSIAFDTSTGVLTVSVEKKAA